MFNQIHWGIIFPVFNQIHWGINLPVFNKIHWGIRIWIDVINCNCLNYFNEINIITLGSFIHCIALLTSEKLTLRISLRDEAGEIRCAKQILAIETKRIKAKSLGFNENASYWPLLRKQMAKYLTINERGWVSYEELWRSRRVLSVEISIVLHMIRKPNSIIVLSFIQNNS